LRPKSPQPPSLPRFALDQNFPRPILDSVLARWIPELTIVALSDVDPRLTKDHDDWEVILALHQLGYDGFISLDKDMIHLPDVVAMIEQTKMTVVLVDEGEPVTATGLLLFHLRFIARRHRQDRPQIWHLAAHDKPPQKIPELIADLEQRTRRKFSPYRKTSRRKSEIDCPSTRLTPGRSSPLSGTRHKAEGRQST
jgi:hypothetical protein